ncbi:Asp-tRNA(Asn)/Glu-tRNA(Gln) amidotransferase subunit GatA [Fluviispira multicolorata]|uniref:Glutamyl-tRNA(Gln) amidotransferase subunit A n=1 Tax=Fluviispira multicolorata TaxID=2654512 RepID=A0A833JG65_9BACT|nr:Asp-tRNA(Asn)/Glu-tRNA(Gln) amidotransferase subunit GatA [Fluviispira multicolorata]KAB8031966.1 Asp-tRNA(Asn)/Glu-tRNA(Gln) amidotransferase subunit GatA [Fluviispira multicolorata]
MSYKNQFSSVYVNELKEHTAMSLVKTFCSGERKPSQYLEQLFEHIERINPELNAITSLQKEYALLRAKELEAKKPEAHQMLYGVPIVIKENIQKVDFPVECASKMLKGYRGQFNATVIESLENAGAIIIGSANMDEFAMGSANEHSSHGVVRNPHDPKRVSGGSSGGSSVACAAGFAPITLGSDTGGSVREPAAFCGIYGFKPTYGRVSRYGLVAFGSSLDQISPFARSVEDLDLVLKVIAHEDPLDSTSLRGCYESQIEKYTLKGKKIGVIRSLLKAGLDDNVLQEFQSLEENLKKYGVEFVDIEIPSLEHTLSVYYVIACAEASSNLSRYDGIRFGHRAEGTEDLNDLYSKSRSEGFGAEVKRRIMLGTFALSAGYYDAFYGRALAVRDMMAKEFASVFEKLDFIYMPTAPTSAFKFGENSHDPLKEYLYDVFTIPANLTGIPAISVPTKVGMGCLPVGVQFMAAKGRDAELIAFASALEKTKLIGTTALV